MQTIAVIAIVAAAALYVARFAWNVVMGKSTGCHCGNETCGSAKAVPRP